MKKIKTILLRMSHPGMIRTIMLTVLSAAALGYVFANDLKRELRAYRFCGGLLFALNVAVTGMVVQMVRDGEGARYSGLLIYAMATYAFYRLTISIINIVKHRRLHSPILSASEALNFATALMAIFMIIRADKELEKLQINITQIQ